MMPVCARTVVPKSNCTLVIDVSADRLFVVTVNVPVCGSPLMRRGRWRSSPACTCHSGYMRKVKEGLTTNDLFAFLTREPNDVVATAHPKAMPVILAPEAEWETWMTASASEALKLQRRSPAGRCVSWRVVTKRTRWWLEFTPASRSRILTPNSEESTLFDGLETDQSGGLLDRRSPFARCKQTFSETRDVHSSASPQRLTQTDAMRLRGCCSHSQVNRAPQRSAVPERGCGRMPR
jgi:hypothetical protein